jgi:hypothetical protein
VLDRQPWCWNELACSWIVVLEEMQILRTMIWLLHLNNSQCLNCIYIKSRIHECLQDIKYCDYWGRMTMLSLCPSSTFFCGRCDS